MLGISRGTIDRIKNNAIPTHETLSAISRHENASTSWLLEGRGAPYYVTTCLNDDEANDYTTDLLIENGWSGYLISDGQRYALAFTLPATYQLGKKQIEYTVLELITGNISEQTATEIVQRDAVKYRYHCNISAHLMDEIMQGKMGTWQLLAAPDAPLKFASSIDKEEGFEIMERIPSAKVAEEGAEYQVMNKLKQLSPEKRKAVEAIIDTLLPATEADNTHQAVEVTGKTTTKYRL